MILMKIIGFRVHYMRSTFLYFERGKDDIDPANYRPIALLNLDQKVITKVLANRLGKHIATIIHSDQTGFIPSRFSFCNVHILRNVIYKDCGKEPPAAIISLDAQKSFDQIEWPFMLKVLEFWIWKRFY